MRQQKMSYALVEASKSRRGGDLSPSILSAQGADSWNLPALMARPGTAEISRMGCIYYSSRQYLGSYLPCCDRFVIPLLAGSDDDRGQVYRTLRGRLAMLKTREGIEDS